MIEHYKNSRGQFAQRPSKNLLPPPKGCKRCMGDRCLRMCPDGVIKTMESFPHGSDLCLVCTNDQRALLPVEPQSNRLTEKKVRELIREELGTRIQMEVRAALASPEFGETVNKAAKKAILFVLQSATPVRKKSVDKPRP